jgi:intracellular septation protein
MDKPTPPPLHPGTKFALEIGPLLVLLAITLKYGLVAAAAPFAGASLIATALLYYLQRKLNWLLVISTVAVGIFAGLTWWYEDADFIKLKITFASGAIGLGLLIAVALGKQPLKSLFDSALQLDERGWRTFTLRFAVFFLLMAGANEIVRRVVDNEGYAIAKLALFFPLPFVFMLTQLPLLKRHSIEPPAQDPPAS